MKPKLAVALDVKTRDEVFHWAKQFEGLPLVLKLGLRVLPELSASDIAQLQKQNFQIFIDAKLHDIPTQVASSVANWAGKGVDYLTLHLGGGRKMLSESVHAAKGSKLTLLGVSVLTSLHPTDLKELGIEQSVENQVKQLVSLGLDCGMAGFVLSVNELQIVKELSSKLVTWCTPGLSLSGQKTSTQDQARVFTVEQAIERGSKLLVVGRAIMESEDPRKTAEMILNRLSAVI